MSACRELILVAAGVARLNPSGLSRSTSQTVGACLKMHFGSGAARPECARPRAQQCSDGGARGFCARAGKVQLAAPGTGALRSLIFKHALSRNHAVEDRPGCDRSAAFTPLRHPNAVPSPHTKPCSTSKRHKCRAPLPQRCATRSTSLVSTAWIRLRTTLPRLLLCNLASSSLSPPAA